MKPADLLGLADNLTNLGRLAGEQRSEGNQIVHGIRRSGGGIDK